MIQIENGVTIPPRSRRKKESKYPWERMNVGDSFVVDDEFIKASAMSCLNHINKSRANKMSARWQEIEDGKYRLWRIE